MAATGVSRHGCPRIDWLSSLLVLCSVLPVIAAVKSVAVDGWSTKDSGYVVLGLASGAWFVLRQLRAPVPMVDVRMLAERRFGGSVAVNVLAMFAIMGNSVMLTQYLQSVLGMSPLTAALWSLAPSVVVGAAAPLAARLSVSAGRPPVMAGGFAVAVTGFLLLTRVEPTSPLALLLVAAGLIAGGLVAVLSLITDYVIGAAPQDRAGSVAGLTETSSELGGALGMAVLGSVLAAVYRTQMTQRLPVSQGTDAGETLAGAVSTAGAHPGPVGDAVLAAGRASYTVAMHGASLVAAGVLVLAAVLTLTLLRGPRAESDLTLTRREASRSSS